MVRMNSALSWKSPSKAAEAASDSGLALWRSPGSWPTEPLISASNLALRPRHRANRAASSRNSEARWVAKGLYDRAVAALGHEGITDVICLLGFYTSVSMTLAFYDVPAGASGMQR